MTLDDTLRKNVAELPAEPGRTTCDFVHKTWSVRLTVERHDPLGCLLWELSLHRDNAVAGAQKEWGERLVQRITGLLEPLKLHEVDAPRQLAYLRSAAPTGRGEALQYYEVALHGLNELYLRRYQGFHEAGKKREQIAFALTYEGLAKLLDDLSAER
jgi:hypothetical protein